MFGGSQNSQAASEAETLDHGLSSASSTSIVSKSYSILPSCEGPSAARPKSTEHRWGSEPQTLSRSKRISKVVRAQSTPPVLPAYIQHRLEEDDDHLQRDMAVASVQDTQVSFAEVMSRLSASEAQDLPEEVSSMGQTLMESVYSPDDSTPHTPLFSFLCLEENLARDLEDDRTFEDELGVNPALGMRGRRASAKSDARPATSAGIGELSRALLHKEMLKESEVFGLLFQRDPSTKELHDVGIAAQHEKDYHKSSSFGSSKPGDGHFSRPERRESSPVVAARMSGHLADSTLQGEHKALTSTRPESPSQRGAGVKAKPKAGLATVKRELQERRTSPPKSGRQASTKSKFHSALYVDVRGDKLDETFDDGWRVAPLDASLDAGDETTSKAGLIAIFPPTPTMRSELLRHGMGEFNSPSVGRGESEVVLEHLRNLDLAKRLQQHEMTHAVEKHRGRVILDTHEDELCSQLTAEGDAALLHRDNSLLNIQGRSLSASEHLDVEGEGTADRTSEIQVHPKVEEAPLLQIVHENSGERVQSAPARQQRRNLDDTRETQDHFPSQTQGHEFSCSDKEDDENRQDLIVGTESRCESDESKSMGPVMQYLGDNQSHPVHLVGQLKHQAKPGKQTLFCSSVLNYTREKRVRQVESLKWGR